MTSIEMTRQEKLAMLLRHARIKADLTQQQLSLTLGKYKTYVSKYESGERRLDVIEFIAVAEALGVEPEAVIKAIRAN